MKFLVAPDSLKGSLTAKQAVAAIAAGIRRVIADADVVSLPLADGGEGTMDALVAATAGHKVHKRVTNPLGEPMEAAFGLLGPDGSTAVVEMAAAAGLNLVPAARRDPRITTSYGVGELIHAAFDSGAKRIIVGLGGSATIDGGAGALQALGVTFHEAWDREMTHGLGGGDLGRIERIDPSRLAIKKKNVEIVIACDVANPLLGPDGAAAVYGPQKGASPVIVEQLDRALSHFAGHVHRATGIEIAQLAGAGAAGGLGAGLIAFLDARMQSGIEIVMDATGFDAHAAAADWIFTAEGAIDSQTLRGKVVLGVVKRSRAAGHAPVVAFGGSVDRLSEFELCKLGLRCAVPIPSHPMTTEEAMRGAAGLLEDAAARVARLICGPPGGGF